MAKVITLDKIVELIKDKTNIEQKVINCECRNDKTRFLVIADSDFNLVPSAYLNSDDELCFDDACESEKVHCILLDTDLKDFGKENPFMYSREALSGSLVIDNSTVSEEDINKYMFRLDM